MKQKINPTCSHCSSTNILLDARTGAVCGDCGKKYCNVKSSCCGAEKKMIFHSDGGSDYHCKSCHKPFVPASEKECDCKKGTNPKGQCCIHCYAGDCAVELCARPYCRCHPKYQSSPDWEGSLRTWFKGTDEISQKNLDWIVDFIRTHLEESRKDWTVQEMNMWIKKYLNPHSEGYGKGLKEGRKQGIQEERERMVKMIEGMKSYFSPPEHFLSKQRPYDWHGYSHAISDLLANLKENE